MGWALNESKVRVAFSDRQKTYMLEKYNQEKITGQKVDPYLASAEMRSSGNFKREEFYLGSKLHLISQDYARMRRKNKG